MGLIKRLGASFSKYNMPWRCKVFGHKKATLPDAVNMGYCLRCGVIEKIDFTKPCEYKTPGLRT